MMSNLQNIEEVQVFVEVIKVIFPHSAAMDHLQKGGLKLLFYGDENSRIEER